MKEIKLTQGKVALVDDEDFERINQFKWYAHKIREMWYATRSSTRFYMHRVIMNAPSGMLVDHKDRDGLNNQKYNLRVTTNAKNLWNQGKHKDNTSGYKGVSFDKKSKKWLVQIRVNDGNARHLGYFDTVEEGAHAYDRAAKELHGEFAYLNFRDAQP